MLKYVALSKSKHIMTNISEKDKPFSMDYVVRTTAKNIRKSIDISIRKTFERIAEFDGNQEKSQEVFRTLTELHAMRQRFDNTSDSK